MRRFNVAYIKKTWVARVGTALNKFLKTNETTENVELTNDPTGITTAGTPFTVNNMNHIEDGIEANDERLVDPIGTPQGVGTGDDVEFANYAGKGFGGGFDLNTALSNGFFRLGSSNINEPSTVNLNYGQLIVSRGGGGSDTISQIGLSYSSDDICWRTGSILSGIFRAWKVINQSLATDSDVEFKTVNTGQGANELYDMNQNVKTDSTVHFANVNPPVDNNDSTLPAIGVGGFTYGVTSGTSITLPSGGVYMCTYYVAGATTSGMIMNRFSGGTAIVTRNNSPIMAWRLS